MTRRVVYVLSLVALLLAATVVPMPFREFSPGSATPIEELIVLDGDTTEIEGDFDLLTVRARTPNLLGVAGALLSPSRDLELRQEVVPEGLDDDEYRRLQAIEFSRTFETAVAVGAQEAGFDARVVTRPVVLSVLPDSPADGELRLGDAILRVDGVAPESSEELVEAVSDVDVGERVRLTVDRGGGDPQEVTITAGPVPGVDRPAGLGITLGTFASDVELPFDAELQETNIIGPSAGMMIAVTTFDLLSDENLAGGRVIAGTGTITGEGRVGPIGGIREKLVAAREAGADLLLVPAEQLGQLDGLDRDGLEVVGVASVEEAISAVRDSQAPVSG